MSLQRAILVVILGVVAVAVFPPAAMAMEHTVGDADGWRPGYNYTNWIISMGMEFRVGDKLVFMYKKGQHNVYNVTGEDFKSCTVPENGTRYDSGNDTITLTTEGKKWYICGVEDHCNKGQKLAVNVLPAAAASGGALAAVPGMIWAGFAAAVAAIAVL